MKRCSSLLINIEMQIKTTRCHLILVRMAIKKSPQTINAGECVKNRELSYIVGGNINLWSHYDKQYRSSTK